MPYPVTGGLPASGAPGTPGAPGQPGVNGKDGVGISSAEISYQVGSSGQSAPAGAWSSSVPSVPAGKYLWARSTITLTSGASTTAYSVSYFPKDGEPGADGQPGSPGAPGKDGQNGSDGSPGKPGAAGTGITGAEITYQVSNTGDVPPTGRWSSAMTVPAKGQYLWVRTITSLSDGSSTTSYALGYVGVDGAPGKDGQNGRDGMNGSDGAPGAPGKDGANGRDGAPGPAGKDGAQGLPGKDGVNGKDGSTGPAGPTGATGQTGATGPAGKDGVNGKDGAPGPAGPAGPTGATGAAGKDGANGISYTPQTPVARTVTVATAYQHTDTTKPYRVTVNARSTQTVTVAGLVSDKVELRVGPTAASVLANGSGGFSVGVWESGITGIALMVGAAILDGGQISADVPAGWYFSINRLTGTTATIVSCFTQSMTP